MMCTYIDGGPESTAFQRQRVRVADYLWVAEVGSTIHGWVGLDHYIVLSCLVLANRVR